MSKQERCTKCGRFRLNFRNMGSPTATCVRGGICDFAEEGKDRLPVWTPKDLADHAVETEKKIADTPELTSYVQRAWRDTEVEGSFRRMPFAVVSADYVKPGASECIVVRSQLPWMPKQLVLSETTAQYFDLHGFYCGVRPQMADVMALPLETFSIHYYAQDHILAVVEWSHDMILPGVVVSLQVTNHNRSMPARFRGILWGLVQCQ